MKVWEVSIKEKNTQIDAHLKEIASLNDKLEDLSVAVRERSQMTSSKIHGFQTPSVILCHIFHTHPR